MRNALNSSPPLSLVIALSATIGAAAPAVKAKPPNIVFVFADQWRGDAMGYAGDPNVKTPNLDRLAEPAVNFTNAVSGCPVCGRYRAILLTGRRPLSHGVFLNDVQLPGDKVTIAEVLASRGYATAYIGKWTRARGGREDRGVRTRRYTYVSTLDGPWLLYDNQADPYQLDNLIDKPQHAELQKELEAVLRRELQDSGDRFLPGGAYIKKWGCPVDMNGTVSYTP